MNNTVQYCTQCGSKSSISDLFCPKCGNKFAKSVFANVKQPGLKTSQNAPDDEDDDNDLDPNEVDASNLLNQLNMNELTAVEIVGESAKNRRQKMENLAYAKKTGYSRPKQKISTKKWMQDFKEKSKSSRNSPINLGGEE